jgi:histidine triad (HIT) family protein
LPWQDIPANEFGSFIADLPRLCQLVKAATGAEGVNVFQNSRPASGQVVFHTHFHVVPRRAGDKVRATHRSPAPSLRHSVTH